MTPATATPRDPALSQDLLAGALLDPASPVPHGLTTPDGRPATRRFAVYRNNVAASLTEALVTAFPVVRKLVGDEFFRAMAGLFLRAHPPRSPLMMLWGAAFPGFLESFPPTARLGYLPDVARIEQALREAYHAADAAPVARDALATSGDHLIRSRFRFAPAMRLVASDWPALSIWRANARNGPKPGSGHEAALILRPHLDPAPVAISTAEARLLSDLAAGLTLGEALDRTPVADLAPLFKALVDGGAIIAIDEAEGDRA